jgi:hypothetical protein
VASLDNPRAKLRRAEAHLEALNEVARAYGEREPCRIVEEPDPDCHGLRYRLVEIREEPPEGLGVIFGDLLYNLRSALDNLAWQLVLLGGGMPGRHTGFPILDHPDKWRTGGKGSLKGVRPEHRKAIKALQPYCGWDNQAAIALWTVNHYGNIDKHQAIHPILFGLQSEPPPVFRVGVDPPEVREQVAVDPDFPMAGKPLYIGATVLRLTIFAPPQTHVNVQAEVSIEIAFGDGFRLKAIPTLYREIVGVVEQFAPDFQ